MDLNDTALLDIPAGYPNLRYDMMTVLRKPAKLISFEPHLHADGKRMCLEVVYPDGKLETLNCANYNHNWVKAYMYQDDAAPLLPAGTIMHVISYFDTTASNPKIIEPRNWRGKGSRSIDDMCVFLGKLVYFTEDEFKAEVAARENRQRPSKQTAQ